jgi:hypothetical protein
MAEKSADLRDIVDAVQDLTRLTIALSGKFDSKSDAIRRMNELSIPPARIASILAMSASDVSSAIAKARKRDSATAGRRTDSSPVSET